MDETRPRIYLFDVDGTLIGSGGAGRQALRAAFTELCGSDDCLDFSFAGMTDRLILRQGLEALGLPVEADRVDRLLDAYVAKLADFVKASSSYTVYPGVRAALDAVAARAGAAVGLGTGNVERGARIKLAPAGLNAYFDFGGFGCDAEARHELLQRGAERGAARLELEVADCEVLVIGDTARDVAAARAIGARCIGLATGGVSREDLMDCGADLAFDTMETPGFLDALTGKF